MDYRRRRYYTYSWMPYPERLKDQIPSLKRSRIKCFHDLNPSPWKRDDLAAKNIIGFLPQELVSCKIEDAEKLEQLLSETHWIQLTKEVLKQ